MKILNQIIIMLVFFCSTMLYSQIPVIIGSIPSSGSTGTIIVDVDDLKDAFNAEFNDGTIITSVSIELLGSEWFLLGSGSVPGGGHISTGVKLSVSSGNGTINSSGDNTTLRSCVSYDCPGGCNLSSSGCSSCSGSCVYSSESLAVAGELGGFGY